MFISRKSWSGKLGAGQGEGEEFIYLMGNRLRCGLTLCSSDEAVSPGE